MGQGRGRHWGLGSVVQPLRPCLHSVVSEQYPIKSQRGHSGSSERGGSGVVGGADKEKTGGRGGDGGEER